MASRSNKWTKLLTVGLMAALVVTGNAAPTAAGSRDHHRDDRHRVERRTGEHHVVGHRDSHHRYPGKAHPVLRHRVIVQHRYPRIGHHLWWTPRWEATLVFGGLSYFYWEGAFYRPWGVGYVAVAAPIGAFVPFLPLGCSVVYVGGTRYYYGDDAYYLWDGERAGYVVVPPPAAAPDEPQAHAMPTVFIYPKAGQNAARQEQDRRECEAWATSQTGFDPRHDQEAAAGEEDDYVRAMSACLEGRDYTVK